MVTVGIVSAGCAKEESDPSPYTCPSSETLVRNDSWFSVEASPGFFVQEVYLGGVLGASVYLGNVQVYLSSNGLSQVTMEIRKEVTGTFDNFPIIATSTVTTGLGNSSVTTPIDFPFSNAKLDVGYYYDFVITGTGGPFGISAANSSLYPGTVSTKSAAGVWSYLSSSQGDISALFTYSVCSGI